MPFIDPAFLLNETHPIQRLLITSADDSDVIKTSFELAKIYHQKGQTVLWIDGNLGEHLPGTFPENPQLENAVLGKIPLTQAIQEKDGISVLTGHTTHFFAQIPEMQQYQLLQDLRYIYPNFDKIIFAVDGKNPVLQKKWMQQTQDTYLLFKTRNLLLHRTLNWLIQNGKTTKGIMGIGKNEEEILLTYMRLRQILGHVPELILDIKKIAP